MRHIRIEYIRSRNQGAIYTDTYVLDCMTLPVTIMTDTVLANGFYRSNKDETTNYDPAKLITPGAIISITPCTARGYSNHDLAQQIKQAEGRGSR